MPDSQHPASGDPAPNGPAPSEDPYSQFARYTQAEMISLARSLPDSAGAVLLALCWHAAARARRRELEPGAPLIAAVSCPQLARITGWHVRTIANSLAKLKQAGLIAKINHRSGVTARYRICDRALQGHWMMYRVLQHAMGAQAGLHGSNAQGMHGFLRHAGD
jgi:DNA-binding transcriptional regulator YhcF (GntR family)